MSHQEQFSEELLQAYVDGELDHAEAEALLEAMMENPVLKTRVCQLQHLKGLVNNAFPVEPYDGEVREDVSDDGRNRWWSTAAGVVFGALAMMLSYTVADMRSVENVQIADASASAAPVSAAKKVLLHLDTSDDERFEETLDYAEELLRDYGQRGVKVEVLANAGGIDLFRADEGAPYKVRLQALSDHYENLEFIACANAIASLRSRGEDVKLLPVVHDDVTALDHVVKRLQEGWAYIKI